MMQKQLFEMVWRMAGKRLTIWIVRNILSPLLPYTSMNASQSTAQPAVEALYIATSPYEAATKFFESKNWRVTTIQNLQELGDCLQTLRQGERRIPLVVLFGHLQELENSPEGMNVRTVVARIAAEAGEIRSLIPFAPISSDNNALYNWTVEERQKIGLEKLQIIGFGSEPERPLRTFAANKQEGAFSNLVMSLGLTTPPQKERGRW